MQASSAAAERQGRQRSIPSAPSIPFLFPLLVLTESIEDSLWSTLRGMEESEMLLRHLAQHLREGGQGPMADQFLQKADEIKERSKSMRKAVLGHENVNPEDPEAAANE